MRQSGFTLLEVVLVMAVGSVVLLVVSQLMSLVLGSYAKQQRITEVEQQGSMVLHQILQTVRTSQEIQSPSTGAVASSLSLTMRDGGQNPTVYDVANQSVRITEGSASPVVLTSPRVQVSNLVFRNVSRPGTRGSIKVEFTIQPSSSGGQAEYTYSKTMYGAASLR